MVCGEYASRAAAIYEKKFNIQIRDKHKQGISQLQLEFLKFYFQQDEASIDRVSEHTLDLFTRLMQLPKKSLMSYEKLLVNFKHTKNYFLLYGCCLLFAIKFHSELGFDFISHFNRAFGVDFFLGLEAHVLKILDYRLCPGYLSSIIKTPGSAIARIAQGQ